jgi:hypothetical protein
VSVRARSIRLQASGPVKVLAALAAIAGVISRPHIHSSVFAPSPASGYKGAVAGGSQALVSDAGRRINTLKMQ